MLKTKAKHYEICYDEDVKSCVLNAIQIAEKGRVGLDNLFGCDKEELPILKASYFSKREDFVNYIKTISGGHEPPIWASGCFYNNEIQVFVNVQNEKAVREKEHTLLHETVHLYFDKFLYHKYDIPRVRWLDESFAIFLDGSTSELGLLELKKICKNINVTDFDVNILDDIKRVKTEKYNGYDMFCVIGFYIFENHLEKEMIDCLKTNLAKVREIGKNILKKSVDFVMSRQDGKGLKKLNDFGGEMKYIETERLILREWTLDDVGDQVEGLGNFETAKYLTIPFPYTAKNSREYISQHLKNTEGNYAYAAELKEGGKVIGGTNLHVDGDENSGGIWINEKYTGKGFGTELWIARAKFAFEVLNLDKLQNGYLEFNNRSKRMQEKIGYKIVGKARRFCPALNEEVDEVLTTLSKSDFFEAMKSANLKAIYDKIKILKR